jgi:hypothetical protein
MEFRIGGSEMSSIVRRAAMAAAFVCMFAVAASAQQQPGAGSQDADSYKPPARFTAPAPAVAPKGKKSAPAQAATATKTIGLISIIGEKFTVRRIGFTVFGNEEEKFPITGWKIDDKAAVAVTRIVQKNFKVKRIQIPAGAFQAFRDGDFIFKSFEAELAKFIAQYTAGQNCDYYLLVSPGYSQIGNTNQGITGLGVVRWDHVFNPGEYVHALSMLTVYDAKMTQIRSEFSTIGQDTFLVAVRGPHQELKEGDKLPPDAKAAVADPRAQKIAWELLEKSLTMTLPKLFAAN